MWPKKKREGERRQLVSVKLCPSLHCRLRSTCYQVSMHSVTMTASRQRCKCKIPLFLIIQRHFFTINEGSPGIFVCFCKKPFGPIRNIKRIKVPCKICVCTRLVFTTLGILCRLSKSYKLVQRKKRCYKINGRANPLV